MQRRTSSLRCKAQQLARNPRSSAPGVFPACALSADYGLLTLVFQEEGVTALQVQNAAGQWVDAPPLPGTCVVNIGDMFRVLTNGAYTPTLHRCGHSVSLALLKPTS